MRIVRWFGVVLTILTAGLLLATPAGAQPPSKLTDHLTDSSGVLTDSDRATVNSAIDRLFHDRHVQLWVVYVDNFNRFKPENWADKTRTASAMGDDDVLLAVGTNTKAYAFDVPTRAGLTTDEINSLQRNKIEPAVGAKDWRGAAVAAADGLNKSTTSTSPTRSPTSAPHRNWLPIAIVAVAVVILIVLVLLYLAHRRRRRATQPAGPSGAQSHPGGRVESLAQALPIAEARVRQISDYATRHRQSIGAEAKARLDDAKRQLAAAHSKEASNAADALAHANGASTLAAQAQTLANDDVLKAHRGPRR